NRVQNLKISAIRRLSPYANEAKERGIKVYHLNIGAPDVQVPEEYFDSISNFKDRVLKYAPSPGLDFMREATANYYQSKNINIQKDEVFITNGASEALNFALMTVGNPGDEIITSNPFYSNYKNFFDQLELTMNVFETSEENGFQLPSEEDIEKVISEKSVAILLSNPCNPTGAVYSKDEIQRIVNVAKRYDLYIIADEVYREFVYEGLEYTSFGEIEGIEDRLILLDSISKRFGACGARIGSIASKNKDFLAQINKLCAGRLAVPTLEQYGAAALYSADEEYFKEVNEEYLKRRDTIYEELKKIEGVEVYKSKGAFYVMPTLPIKDAEDFAKWLLTDFNVDGETVMMAPGDGFYYNSDHGKNQVRLAFVLNCEDIKKAMRILALGLKEYQSLER
ncbi:MAG: pyridoxal phosphate-dependent aminotransferase, partial [Tissierellia bacterium]|nr:pyridoxal phosphate-dependent aminotransferase [Tissierellia bacterium]